MDDPTSNLRDDEVTILLLIAQGQSPVRVARAVALSEATVRRRLTAVQQKLGANSRINAVYLGAKRGLI